MMIRLVVVLVVASLALAAGASCGGKPETSGDADGGACVAPMRQTCSSVDALPAGCVLILDSPESSPPVYCYCCPH